MDGADGQFPKPQAEVRLDVDRARDRSLDRAERAHAYQRVALVEVGETALLRARNVERETGLERIHLKFEGGNPSGTQKDRVAFAHALDALKRGHDAVTVATCGNFGAALSFAAQQAGLLAVVYIPESYQSRRLAEIESLGAEVVRTPGDYEDAVERSRRRALEDGLYDANPGGANTRLQLEAYAAIAHEIASDLGDAPSAVAIPVGNGTTLAGVAHGFLQLHADRKITRIPRIVAGSSFRNNPVIEAVETGAASCQDLSPERIRETAINEPLVSWHAIDGDLALSAIRRTDGWASQVSDRNLRSMSTLLRRREGINVLPASAASLFALLDMRPREPLPEDDYVAVLTGRRE